MTTDIREGGADWELGEAARKLSVVLGVEGTQAEALRLALSDHAAAVGSKSTQMIAALFTPVMTGLQETRNDIASLAQQQTHADRVIQTIQKDVEGRANYFYSRMDSFLKDADARFKGYDAAFTQVAEALGRLGELEGRVTRLETGQAKLEVRVDAVEAHGAPAEAVSELHQLRDEVGEIRSLLILTRRQLWLTWIPIATFVILIVISIIVRGWQ